jgi:hypothetical protein
MPNAVLQSFAKKTGKSLDTLEKYWNVAVKEAEKTFNKKQKDFTDKQYAFVTGMVKNMAGIKESRELTKKFLESKKSAKQFIEDLTGATTTTSDIADTAKQPIVSKQYKKDEEDLIKEEVPDYTDDDIIYQDDSLVITDDDVISNDEIVPNGYTTYTIDGLDDYDTEDILENDDVELNSDEYYIDSDDELDGIYAGLDSSLDQDDYDDINDELV